MQPGIAFPRALQGETLDFSEPQPNRCWLLESHQKQAFMLLSYFPPFLSLSLTHTFYAFSLFSPYSVPCPYPFIICLFPSHFFTLSDTLSSSLSRETSYCPNFSSELSKQCCVWPQKSVQSPLSRVSSTEFPILGGPV